MIGLKRMAMRQATTVSFVIRFGTPDCEWGHKMPDMDEDQFRLCYSEFRKHFMQRYDLREWDTTRTCIWTWSTGG